MKIILIFQMKMENIFFITQLIHNPLKKLMKNKEQRTTTSPSPSTEDTPANDDDQQTTTPDQSGEQTEENHDDEEEIRSSPLLTNEQSDQTNNKENSFQEINHSTHEDQFNLYPNGNHSNNQSSSSSSSLEHSNVDQHSQMESDEKPEETKFVAEISISISIVIDDLEHNVNLMKMKFLHQNYPLLKQQ